MYIVDFFQRAFRKENIGIIIYLILNTLFVMLLFGHPLIGIIIYGLSLVIALSPIGEFILRIQQGCRRIKRQDHLNRLMPLFNEVYARAKQKDPSLPDNIRLFISREQSANAFATGRKTICLTSGLLLLSDEEIKATLAHEFGHLSNRDTDLILFIAVGNLIVTIAFVFWRTFFWTIGTVTSVANRSFAGIIVTFLIDLVLVFCIWIWTKIGTLLVMHSSRKNEFEADRFAYDLGYGRELISLLNRFESMELPHSKGLWANLVSSHPETSVRIEHVEQLLEQHKVIS